MGGMINQLRSLGLDVPDETQGVGLNGMLGQPQEDPMEMFQRTMAENAPLITASRNAALKTPQMREEELYKQKIQKMFGVKLGEKNPKWKSILRTLGEGALDIGSTRYGGPTIRGTARRQAQEDYKMENDVLGKDSTATLARMGQAAQQANVANIAKMKDATANAVNALKNSPLSPKGKQLLAQAELYRKQGNYADAGVVLRLAQAEKTDAETNNIGKTDLIRNAEKARDNPDFVQDIFNIYGAMEAGKTAGGGGRSRTTNSERSQIIDDPKTQTKVVVKVPSTSTTTTGGDPAKAYNFMANIAKLGGAGSPSSDTQSQPGPSMQSTSPTPAESKPTFSSVTKTRSPGISTKQTQAAAQAIETPQRVRNLDVRTPAWGKLYTPLKTAAVEAANVNDAVLAAALDVDSVGQSALSRYTGGLGAVRNVFDRISGTKPASIINSDDVIQTAADKYRHDITGAGAGYQEIKYLTSRFPEIGKQAGLDHKYTAMQKALTLHFVAQKSLWNFEHDGEPALNGNFFPADTVNRQIDTIMNSYKQMEKEVAGASTPSARRKIVEKFRTDLQTRMNARGLYDTEWQKANPSAPTGRKIVYR